MSNQKYKKGDRVKVTIGHSLWSPKKMPQFDKYKYLGNDYDFHLYDMNPELTEDTATVEYTYGEMSEIDFRYSKGERGYKQYSLKFDKHGSISWFDENIITPA